MISGYHYQWQYLACDTSLQFLKILQWEEIRERVHRISIIFFTIAYDSTIISIKILVKKIDNSKCGWKCAETRNLIHCWWECKWHNQLVKILLVYYKCKGILTLQFSNTTLRYISKKNKSLDPCKSMCINVHKSITQMA